MKNKILVASLTVMFITSLNASAQIVGVDPSVRIIDRHYKVSDAGGFECVDTTKCSPDISNSSFKHTWIQDIKPPHTTVQSYKNAAYVYHGIPDIKFSSSQIYTKAVAKSYGVDSRSVEGYFDGGKGVDSTGKITTTITGLRGKTSVDTIVWPPEYTIIDFKTEHLSGLPSRGKGSDSSFGIYNSLGSKESYSIDLDSLTYMVVNGGANKIYKVSLTTSARKWRLAKMSDMKSGEDPDPQDFIEENVDCTKIKIAGVNLDKSCRVDILAQAGGVYDITPTVIGENRYFYSEPIAKSIIDTGQTSSSKPPVAVPVIESPLSPSPSVQETPANSSVKPLSTSSFVRSGVSRFFAQVTSGVQSVFSGVVDVVTTVSSVIYKPVPTPVTEITPSPSISSIPVVSVPVSPKPLSNSQIPNQSPTFTPLYVPNPQNITYPTAYPVQTTAPIPTPYYYQTPTPTPYPYQTATPSSPAAPTASPQATPTYFPTPTPIITHSPTPSPAYTPWYSPTPYQTNIPTPVPTVAPTQSPTPSATHSTSPTPSRTYYPTPTPTLMPTASATPTPSITIPTALRDGYVQAQTSAVLYGQVSSIGGAPVTRFGFQYGPTASYGYDVHVDGTYYSPAYYNQPTAVTLNCGSTYHYRAYATNSGGTGYSSDGTFPTLACSSPSPSYSPSPSGSPSASIQKNDWLTAVGLNALKVLSNFIW